MRELLLHSNNLFRHTPHCHEDIDCYYQCLQDSFYEGIDTYNCIRKLCCYVMNYGPAYASEIYHFLNKTKLLEREYNNCEIKILSLGCGFSPEIYALSKYITERDLNIGFSYVGFDNQEEWNELREPVYNSNYITHDLLDGFTLRDYDIVFICKVFSTIRKGNNDNEERFFDILETEIQQMKEGSHLIFNEVNHRDFGRDIFNRQISGLFSEVTRYYFPVENAYTGNYEPIQDIMNVFEYPDNLAYQPKDYVNKSVIFDYKK